jgi:amiloride-sensitive sodium channel
LRLQYGIDVTIEAIPKITKTDKILKKLSPNDRGCFFKGEKLLKYFKIYSVKNCITECLSNYSLQFHNCFDDIWLPNENENYCYKINQSNYNEYFYVKFFDLDIPSSPNCSCLPTCDSVTYHIKYFYKFSTESDEISINVRVNTEDAILFRRYQQFTFSDVVSYVGGLLGLFAGISMLSIVEIFYFFIIRVAVDVWRRLRGQ